MKRMKIDLNISTNVRNRILFTDKKENVPSTLTLDLIVARQPGKIKKDQYYKTNIIP